MVDRVAWDPANETGHETVDEQHKSMVALFNELLEADATDAGLVPAVLDRLLLHVGTHFTAEEQLMREYALDTGQIAEHVGEHEKLTAYVRDRVMAYRVGELPSALPLVEFLQVWLHEHIAGPDRELAEHMRASS